MEILAKASWRKDLYDQYAPKLLGVAMRYSNNKEDAEDMLHDCFLIIYDQINKYRGEGSFEGWLRRIVVNNCLKRYSKKGIQLTFQEDGLEESVANETEDEIPENRNFSKDQLLEALGELPAGYKAVFNLYVLDGFSHKEIGEALNISEVTSRSQFSRAKKLLQKILLKQ